MFKKSIISCSILGLFSFLPSMTFAATPVDLRNNQMQLLHVSADKSDLNSLLNFTANDSLELLKQRTTPANITHSRYRQLYQGIPVWGHHVLVTSDDSQQVVALHGALLQGIGKDISTQSIQTNKMQAKKVLFKQQNALKAQNPEVKDWVFENITSEKVIYLNERNQAKLAIFISFFADSAKGGHPTRPTYIIDATTGEMIESYDGLAFAAGTGPGGNAKVGQYHYGTDFPTLDIIDVDGSTCQMENTNVKTVDLDHGTSGTSVFEFGCYENTKKEINGAYSPLNDAHFFGGVVFDMFNDWYQTAPLTFQLTMRVHYSNNYENAFWNGSSMTFGDGRNTFYPLTSLDVSAHEVSHGVTEQNSGLQYSKQPGGINESFSDISGDAAEFYMKGTNDFLVGADIFKAATGALRYFADPTLDGRSIGHVNDYYDGLGVHYSSGVFNRAFYNLATTAGWDTHKAFDLWVKANLDYWGPLTNFQQGAEGILDAALVLKDTNPNFDYPATDVRDAFAVVGIDLVIPAEPIANFEFSKEFLTVSFTDTSSSPNGNITTWAWDFGDGGNSTLQNPIYTYAAGGAYQVNLMVTDVDDRTHSVTQTVNVAQLPEYCTVTGGSNSYEWISGVSVGGFSNSSGASGYSDFTGQVIDMTKGTGYPMVLTPGYSGASYTENWLIWVDLNQDGDFDDAGEQLFNGTGSNAMTGTLTVPATAMTGQTVMRVSMQWNSSVSACEAFSWGEVEDYTINVQ
ncbi:M4 family metallopeptidase [uncultured Shewanella sp.]|uniref:M4 family metallopeptidase n=1 Tax=uncultured Shewanella sp. TaxID=173975 RepID=UPI00263A06E1|nr:M4 family metallopeptidase [uncultured Shewanella sp.]